MAAVSPLDGPSAVQFVHTVNPADSAYPPTQPIVLPGTDSMRTESGS